jgi:hypothetical protein
MFKAARVLVLALAAGGLGACGSLSGFDGILTGSIDSNPAIQQAAPGKVYVFRGMGGQFATLELDRLGEKLVKVGVNAEVFNHLNWRAPADQAIKRYKSESMKSPIILVGHSAGADAALRFANALKDEKVPVSLIIGFDPTRLSFNVPNNVDRYINIYSSWNFFGGGNVSPGSDFHGHFASVDFKWYWEVLHVNLVRIDGLMDKVIAKIVQATNFPPPLDGPTVPIKYAMPRGAAIELWDSGLPIRTEPGDTVKSVAERYAVPAWAVAQLNGIETWTRLEPGRRLIVPRNLDALAPGGSPPLTSYVGKDH